MLISPPSASPNAPGPLLPPSQPVYSTPQRCCEESDGDYKCILYTVVHTVQLQFAFCTYTLHAYTHTYIHATTTGTAVIHYTFHVYNLKHSYPHIHCIHTYIHSYNRAAIYYTYIHIYIHTYIDCYIHTSNARTHTYMHTYYIQKLPHT